MTVHRENPTVYKKIADKKYSEALPLKKINLPVNQIAF
jgi:hypothetical protein